MKKALLVALTLVISVAFVTVVFAQAPAPDKAAPAAAPEKVKKAPAAKQSGVKEESGPTSSTEKKVEKKKAPKAGKSDTKEETGPAAK